MYFFDPNWRLLSAFKDYENKLFFIFSIANDIKFIPYIWHMALYFADVIPLVVIELCLIDNWNSFSFAYLIIYVLRSRTNVD